MKLGNSNRGLFQRRECLVPTRRGCFLLVLIVSVLSLTLAKGVHPFLAVNDPVYGGALVVEGWMPEYAFDEAIADFRQHHYTKLYVTGGPLAQGSLLSEYRTYAELGATIIIRKGLATEFVEAVPAPDVEKDRTYASAIALKNWLHQHDGSPKNYHVISQGVHARRTRLLFEKALGDTVNVGITAIVDQDYDPARWWGSSAGVRTVIGETIAYAYARLLF